MTSTAAANAAAAVAASFNSNSSKDNNGELLGIPMGSSSHRRGISGRKGLESTSVGSSGLGSYLSRSVNDHAVGRKHSPQSATTDGNNTAVDGGASVGKPVSTKNRNRRASEGSHLIRGEGKRVAGELRCERCGKGYKHSSCLTKHMCVCPHLIMPSSGRLARERDMLSCPCWLPACPASLSLPFLIVLSLFGPGWLT